MGGSERSRGRWAAAVAVAVGAVGLAAAADHKPGHKTVPPVPPTQEIMILDPGVDPRGNPTAVVRPTYPGGPQQIDVPPAVLVHKFYYTGDRTFQGPMIPGGPMIVSVNHPKTLERVYVPVTLPPGAPRITYTSHAIRYDYGPQSISVVFAACGHTSVRYGQATRLGEAARHTASAVRTGANDLIHRTGIPEGLHKAGEGAKNVFVTGADRVKEVGKAALRPVANVARQLPGAQALTSTPADRAMRDQPVPPRLGPGPDNTFIPRGP